MLLTNLLKNLELVGDMFDGSHEYPAIQLYSNKDNLLLAAETPGFNEKDLDISIAEDVINISGKRGKSEQEEGLKMIRSERWNGNFSRRIELPVEVESNRAKAVLKDGLLEITLPIKEKVKPRKIAVQGA